MRLSILLYLLLFISFNSSSQNEYDPQAYEELGFSGGGVMTALSISPHDQNKIMVSTNMQGVFLSCDSPKEWRMIHNSDLRYHNAQSCFHPKDPDVVFTPQSDKLMVSRDGGQTWSKIGNIGSIEREIAIHPDRPDTMLAGSSNSVYLSRDGGNNWSETNGPTGSILGFHFDKNSHGGNTFYAATSAGLWKSEDGGSNWNQLSMGIPQGDIVSFGAGSRKTDTTTILYIGVANTLYRSVNNDTIWQSLESSFSGNARFLLVSDVNPEIVWAIKSSQIIMKSENAGELWEQTYYHKTSDPGFNLEHNYFTSWMGKNAGTYSLQWASIAPSNPDFIAFTTEMLFIYTENGGKTWKNGHSIPVKKPGESVPKSFYNTGLNVTTSWHYYVDPFETNRHYIAYTDIGFARSLDRGETWLFWPYWGPQATLPFEWHNTCYEIAFDPDIPGKMWAAFSRAHDIPNWNAIVGNHVSKLSDKDKKGGIAFSDDFAVNWKHIGFNSGLPERPTTSVIVDSESPANNRTLYAAVYEEGVFKSTDDGHTWKKKSEGLGSAINMNVVRLKLHDDGTLFCLVTAVKNFSGNGVGLYRSVNGGDNWEKVNHSRNFLWPRDFDVDPDDSNIIYLGVRAASSQTGGLWRTIDGGNSWEALNTTGNTFGAYLHPNRPGWVYMSLCEGKNYTNGLWLSKDYGDTWHSYTKIPHRWIQRVTVDPEHDSIIYATTFGASVYKLSADPTGEPYEPSQIIDNISEEGIPDPKIYPNPASEFLIVRSGKRYFVDYEILNLEGKTMNKGELKRGRITPPGNMGSGIYILRLTSGISAPFYRRFIWLK
jgi:photosystem II stability/assembly factor-like uncharacterized protein